MTIQSTSLIQNKDGSIYHLNLLPGELAPTIILVGDPDRPARVAKHFDHIELHKQKRGFVTYTGTIGQKRLSVISTGIGGDSIDIVINEIDALWNVDFATREVKKQLTSLQFIRLGTSGALQPDIALNSLILSRYALAFDGLLDYYQHSYSNDEQNLLTAIRQQFQQLPTVSESYLASGSPTLLQHFAQLGQAGITLTMAGFYGPQHRQLRAPLISSNIMELAQQFGHQDKRITNFEMETAAIYGLATLLGHECCSINTVIVNRAIDTVSKNIDQAVDNMIDQALQQLVS